MKIRSLALAAVTALGVCSAAHATNIIYSSGHCINTTNATAGGVTVTGSNPICGFGGGQLGSALAGGFGAYDALVIGENEGIFSSTDKATILNFVTTGGHAVVLGAHGSEVNFLSTTFGITVSAHAGGFSSFDNAPISRVAGSGPATLNAANGSWFIDDVPPLGDIGTILYTRDAGGIAAFNKTIGTGTLTWLAWDFCCGPAPEEVAWYSVLGTSAIQEGGGTAPEPASLALLGLGLAGFGIRRRKAKAA